MKRPHFCNNRIQCEKCDRATTCRKLEPCKDYSPAVDSNFNASIKMPHRVEVSFSICD